MPLPSILRGRRFRARGRRRTFVAAVVALSGVAIGVGAQEGLPVVLDFTPNGPPAESASHGYAPADRSFGHYPMSTFGIDNTIKAAEKHAEEYREGLRFDDGPIAFVVSSLHDWERQFPFDPWIAKDLGELARFYDDVGTSRAREAAHATIVWLERDYPQSPQGLAFASHLSPEDADAMRTATSSVPAVSHPVAAAARHEATPRPYAAAARPFGAPSVTPSQRPPVVRWTGPPIPSYAHAPEPGE